MKKSKKLFNSQEKSNGDVFWNKITIKAFKKNKINIKDEEDDINPDFQAYFPITKLTDKSMNDEDKSTVYDIPKKAGF